MISILFLIHDLGQGGAEKVLVNLVNNMDKEKFDITVTALFGGGVNEQFLSPDVKYNVVFKKMIPGNSKFMKFLSPSMLHKLCVKENYDIEVSYLEGPSARIISGCQDKDTKLVSWIHSTIPSLEIASSSFRTKREALRCYDCFDITIGVSRDVLNAFIKSVPIKGKTTVLYNAIDSDEIINRAKEEVGIEFDEQALNLIAVGSLKPVKGFNRLLKIIKCLVMEGFNVHLYLLGKGPLRDSLKSYIEENSLEEKVTLLGYQTNPYKYISKSDMLVCCSYSEGFSTVVMEALILGIPICTTDVSGMKELLGSANEYGVITDNNDDSLYRGLRELVESKDLLDKYRIKAKERGADFRCSEAVYETEKMFLGLIKD